jgi:TonB family protein
MGVLALGLLLVTVPAASLRARQAGPAPLTGTLYDVSGGVLPGVQVTLVDANQVSATAASTAEGRFEFPAVAPGKYTLSFALPGFKLLRHEFELRDARDWDRAFTLQVGDLRETVTAGYTGLTSLSFFGGNVRPPKKLKDVKPVYPAAMRDAGLTGTVSLEAVIGRDGTVTFVRVLSSQVHPDFAIAAADAVRQWKFTPTLLNGQAVEVVMTVSVRFDMEN